jgi:hypothetical protein
VGNVTGYSIAAIVALVLPFIGWLFGRRGAKRDAALKDARDYQRTMERMQDADTVAGDASAAEWLRERGQR